MGGALIDAPSLDYPEDRKTCLIIKNFYAFTCVNELFDSIYIIFFPFFCKKIYVSTIN